MDELIKFRWHVAGGKGTLPFTVSGMKPHHLRREMAQETHFWDIYKYGEPNLMAHIPGSKHPHNHFDDKTTNAVGS